jgi:2-keto-4-pentenoate hydratase
MLTEKEHQAAANALHQAEVDRVLATPISSTYPTADIADAYQIAKLVTDAKIAAGRKVRGKKIGFTSKVMRDMVNATEPDYGNIFDDWFIDNGSAIPRSRLNRPLVEIELAFILARDLSGPHVNAVDVIQATDFVMPAFEIVDSRYKERGPNFLIDSVADAASCGLVILGGRPVRLTEVDISRVGASLSKNGVIEVTGTSAAVMGNPINAVAWLARKLDEFGDGISAGEAIISGSFVQMIQFDQGDTLTADFGELGILSFGVV